MSILVGIMKGTGGTMKNLFIILFAGLLVATASAETRRFSVSLEGAPSIGAQNAPVTIVEFIDYQ
jgi:hypothetical protein